MKTEKQLQQEIESLINLIRNIGFSLQDQKLSPETYDKAAREIASYASALKDLAHELSGVRS